MAEGRGDGVTTGVWIGDLVNPFPVFPSVVEGRPLEEILDNIGSLEKSSVSSELAVTVATGTGRTGTA